MFDIGAYSINGVATGAADDQKCHADESEDFQEYIHKRVN